MVNLSIYSQNYSMDYLKEMKTIGISKVFISLHIPEEIKNKEKILAFLTDIKTLDFEVIADISPITLDLYSIELLKLYNITTLRIDYGFSLDDIINLSSEFKIVLNASTLTKEQLSYLQNKIDLSQIEALHNFYPKVETGLSMHAFKKMNKMLKSYNLKVSCFIHGDKEQRGPIYQGLPTIEAHRDYLPYVSYVLLKDDVDEIYVGDIAISTEQIELIKQYDQGITTLKVHTTTSYLDHLTNKILTIRKDSNDINLRIEESRTKYQIEHPITVCNIKERKCGSITIDNENALRYNGEVMITLKPMPINMTLNVIGEVDEQYIHLLSESLCGKHVNLVN